VPFQTEYVANVEASPPHIRKAKNPQDYSSYLVGRGADVPMHSFKNMVMVTHYS